MSTERLQNAWNAVLHEVEAVAAQSREETLSALNQVLRRLRQYQGESEWAAVLLDAMSRFSSECALFAICNSRYELRAARGLVLAEGLRVDPATANALLTAATSKDVVVALKTVREAGPELAQAAQGTRMCAAPVLNQERVVALLVVFAAEAPVSAVEVIAGMASLVLERRLNAELAVQILPAAITSAPRAERRLPAWADLNEEDRVLHMRAQRFARMKVAEMQLAQPEAGRAGREQNNVYLFWKSAIDAARDGYRNQFMANRTMVDYLHLELVRTAAEGDEKKMGADYPGSME